MSELFKCGRCGKVLISEEYDAHKCKIVINGKINVIEADYWIEGKHPTTDEDVISAKALDGTTYWIVKRILKASDKVPFVISDESLQVEDSDGDFTEPEKIRIINQIE